MTKPDELDPRGMAMWNQVERHVQTGGKLPMPSHASTPYEFFRPLKYTIYGGDPVRRIAVVDYISGQPSAESEATAAFIVRACNSHDALVQALRELLSYTLACEGMLNVTPAGQVENARAALAKAEEP